MLRAITCVASATLIYNDFSLVSVPPRDTRATWWGPPMARSTSSKLPDKYAQIFERLPIETKLLMAKLGQAMREQQESWEQALRGDTSKLEARIMAQTATVEERELICDLVAGRVKGKQYLNRLNKEITRDLVAGHFLEVLRDNPSAKLTKQMKGDVEKLFRVRHSLAAKIWAKVKNELARNSTQV
jgi:hypothetical protein